MGADANLEVDALVHRIKQRLARVERDLDRRPTHPIQAKVDLHGAALLVEQLAELARLPLDTTLRCRSCSAPSIAAITLGGR